MKTVLFLMAAVSILFGQNPDRYIATANTTALTIQQPATQGRQVTFGSASVYCASASTATLSWNGSAATATAGTAIRIPGTASGASETVWTGSNVGAGTTGPVYNVPAGATGLLNLDLSWIRMGNVGTGANFTISTSNTCTITITWTSL